MQTFAKSKPHPQNISVFVDGDNCGICSGDPKKDKQTGAVTYRHPRARAFWLPITMDASQAISARYTGDYTGGAICVEGTASDIRYVPLEFDGWRQLHWTRPFRGERYSLVW